MPCSRFRFVDLERLDEHRRVAAVPAGLLQRGDQQVRRCRARCWRNRSGAWSRGRSRHAAPLGQRDDLVEASGSRTGRHMPGCRGAAAAGAPCARSVFSSASVKSSVNQPVTLRRRRSSWSACGSANSGWSATSVVSPISFSCRATSTAVLGRHQVGLDQVGALVDRQFVGRQRVLGPLAAGAAVGDDDRAATADCGDARAWPPPAGVRWRSQAMRTGAKRKYVRKPLRSATLPDPSRSGRCISRSTDRRYEAEPDIRTSVLDLCREHLGLTGSKKGCDHGQCGACTVLINGRRVNSCLTLAVMHQDDEITTIEGLGTPEALHPLQARVRHAMTAINAAIARRARSVRRWACSTRSSKGWPSHVERRPERVRP